MRRIARLLFAVAMVAGFVACKATASRHADGPATPIFVTKIPHGYRDWRLVSVACEAGELNDIPAILGKPSAVPNPSWLGPPQLGTCS